MRTSTLATLLLAASLHASDLPVRTFTIADGLIHNRVKRIVQDSRGLLWMCTSAGLSRFDGAQFKNFGLAEGLPYSSVNDLLETSDGTFWLASNQHGIIRFSANRPSQQFQAFLLGGYTASKRVNRIYRDPTGSIWLSTDGGLFRMSISANGDPAFERIPLHIPQHPDASFQVWNTTRDSEGSLWLATRFGVVRILPGGSVVHYPVKQDVDTDHAFGLLITPENGLVWIASQYGLKILNPFSAAHYRDLARENAPLVDRSLIAPASAQLPNLASTLRVDLPSTPGAVLHLQSGSHSGLSSVSDLAYSALTKTVHILLTDGVVDYSDRQFTPLTGLRSSAMFQYVTEDQRGNLWISTQASGALRILRNGLSTFHGPGEVGSIVSRFFEDRSGHLIVTTRDWQVSRFDGQAFERVRPNLPEYVRASSLGQAVIEDHAGDWWFATARGLARFSGVRQFHDLATVTPRIYTKRDGLAQDTTFNLFEDSRHDIWISSLFPQSEILTRWERSTGRFYRYSEADGLQSGNAVMEFHEDLHGVLWICLREGGIGKYENGRFQIRSTAEGLSNLVAVPSTFDSKGRMLFWIGGAGLYRIDDLNAATLRPVLISTPREAAEGLVANLVSDRAGDVYLMNTHGVYRLPPDAVDGKSGGVVRSRVYTTDDGLSDGEPYTAFCDRKGRLWFGTTNGVSYLDPHEEGVAEEPPVRIGGVRIGATRLPVAPSGESQLAGIELQPGQSQLEVEFFGISSGLGGKLLFQHRLAHGGDEPWSDSTPIRSVLLSGLSTGSYEFEVRAIAPGGLISSQPARLSFRVLPPIWRRWWFLSLAGFAILSTYVGFERYRAARVRELNAALTESRVLASELREANQTLELESAITRIIAESATPSEAASRALEFICQTMNWSMGVIWQVDRDAHRLRCLGIWPPEHVDDTRVFASVNLGEGLPAMVLANGQAHWVEDFTTSLESVRSGFAFPVLLGREVIAVAGFFSVNRRPPVADQVRALSALGSHIGQLVERKRADETVRKAREERLTELERVRQRIAADLHDDIGSSLTQISIMSEVAHRRNQQGDSKSLSESLSAVAQTSRNLVDAMSDIVWAINPAKDSLSDLTQRMRRLASDTFTSCGIKFHLELPRTCEDLKLGANIRREIYLIFKEGITNIAKHSRATEVNIRMAVDGAIVHLALVDNGHGFDPKGPACGHGLTSLRARATALQGKLAIDTSGEGTAIRLHVPLPT